MTAACTAVAIWLGLRGNADASWWWLAGWLALATAALALASVLAGNAQARDLNEAQARASKARYQQSLTAARFGEIVTEIVPAGPFYYAEPNHQQYLEANRYGYCNHGFCQAAYPGSGRDAPTS